MKKKFKVLWTRPAQRDLEEIIDFIATERPRIALKQLKNIQKKAETLKINPERGRKLPEISHLKGMNFKELVIKPWRLIYQIVQKEVLVLVVIDSRRNLDEILFERLTRK